MNDKLHNKEWIAERKKLLVEKKNQKIARDKEKIAQDKKNLEVARLWRYDDREWQKGRRSEWRILNRKIKQLSFIDKFDLETLKSYFLTGVETYPLSDTIGGFWFEFWLNPEHTKERLEAIKKKYIDEGLTSKIANSIEKFTDLMEGPYRDKKASYTLVYQGDSFFDNLEDFFYEHLVAKNFAEYYPEKDKEKFASRANQEFRVLLGSIREYLRAKDLIDKCILKYRIPFWVDTIRIAYYTEQTWGHLVTMVDEIDKNPESNHPLQVKMAREIRAVFDDPTMPEQLLLDVQKARVND